MVAKTTSLPDNFSLKIMHNFPKIEFMENISIKFQFVYNIGHLMTIFGLLESEITLCSTPAVLAANYFSTIKLLIAPNKNSKPVEGFLLCWTH